MLSVWKFSEFLSSFGIPPLLAGNIPHPPVDLSISLWCCLLHKSIQHNPCARHNNRVGFNSLGVLRSGAAAFMTFSCAVVLRISFSHSLGKQTSIWISLFPLFHRKKCIITVFKKGMSVRLGTAVIPSMVLFAKHIQYDGLSQVEEYILVAAQVAELCGWLNWLRPWYEVFLPLSGWLSADSSWKFPLRGSPSEWIQVRFSRSSFQERKVVDRLRKMWLLLDVQAEWPPVW